MEVSGQFHSLATLPPGKESKQHIIFWSLIILTYVCGEIPAVSAVAMLRVFLFIYIYRERESKAGYIFYSGSGKHMCNVL